MASALLMLKRNPLEFKGAAAAAAVGKEWNDVSLMNDVYSDDMLRLMHEPLA